MLTPAELTEGAIYYRQPTKGGMQLFKIISITSDNRVFYTVRTRRRTWTANYQSTSTKNFCKAVDGIHEYGRSTRLVCS